MSFISCCPECPVIKEKCIIFHSDRSGFSTPGCCGRTKKPWSSENFSGKTCRRTFDANHHFHFHSLCLFMSTFRTRFWGAICASCITNSDTNEVQMKILDVRARDKGAAVPAEFTSSLRHAVLLQLPTILLAPQTSGYTDAGHQRHSIWRDQFYITMGHERKMGFVFSNGSWFCSSHTE